MKKAPHRRALIDGYRVRGFKPLCRIETDERDPSAFMIELKRHQKKRSAQVAANPNAAFMTAGGAAHATLAALVALFILILSGGGLTAKSAA